MSFGKTLIKVILLPSTGVELVGGRDLGEEADERRLARVLASDRQTGGFGHLHVIVQLT